MYYCTVYLNAALPTHTLTHNTELKGGGGGGAVYYCTVYLNAALPTHTLTLLCMSLRAVSSSMERSPFLLRVELLVRLRPRVELLIWREGEPPP